MHVRPAIHTLLTLTKLLIIFPLFYLYLDPLLRQANPKMITGPLKEMLVRNSTFTASYKPLVSVVKMASAARVTRAGVVVIFCSDPCLNPYQILGLDTELRTLLCHFYSFHI